MDTSVDRARAGLASATTRHGLTDRLRLRQRYLAVNHPMAAEVVRWLDRADTVDGWVEEA